MPSRLETEQQAIKIIDKLGILDEIEGDVEEEVLGAIKRYKEFHWGLPFQKVLYFKDVPSPEVVYGLGVLTLVGYATIKKGDETSTLYIHGFHNPPPILASDKNGQLHIVMGGYTVEPRGIVH